MALELARGNAIDVAVLTGSLRRTHPVELDAVEGRIAVDFTIEGGRGYVPVTIYGLTRHDGWQLERLTGDQWVAVDQSVHGDDFWQARYDDEARRYVLTWNVPNRGQQRYRVVWVSDGE